MATAAITAEQLQGIPKDVLKVLPAQIPPDGIIPNFDNPQTRVPAILGVGFVFLALALFCFSIRIYTRIAYKKSWRWDDCMYCALEP